MTAQIGDALRFAGLHLTLASEPLAPWLQRRRNRHLRLRADSTANRRGYRAEWDVEVGLLRLVRLHGQQANGDPLSVRTLFPQVDGPVPASWFTGALVCPLGRVQHYVHSGHATRREYELKLWIIEGRLVEQRLTRLELPGCRSADDDPGDLDPG